MYHTLLVPLDGSALSEQALPVARSLALQWDATLHLVHVHAPNDPIYIEGMPVMDEEFHSLSKQHEQAYLESAKATLAADTQLSITLAVLDGPVAQALTTYAVTNNIDLIVLTSHGHSGFERAWLGSVTDALIRQSHIPVLLLHADAENQASKEPVAFRQILIPLDGAALAEQIIPHALALGTLTEASYTLLHVVNPSPIAHSALRIPAVDDGEVEVQRILAAEQYLSNLTRHLQAEGLTLHTRIVVDRQPAVAILEDAREHGNDLIALSTHGRRGLARLLIGSVADKIVRGADTPILLYRPHVQEE